MLRRPHVRPFLTIDADTASVEFLRDDASGRVVAFLDRLCRLARRLEGRPRAVLAEALRRQERRVRDARRLDGVAKTLLDACVLRAPPGHERAGEVRSALFRARARSWPPLPGDADVVLASAAGELGLDPGEIERLLYADAPAERRLVRAPDWDGGRLLERYNLELARAPLLDATRVVLTAAEGWRDLFRAVKLARLMYRVERAGKRRYRLEVTGPAADFVARPQRYGVRLARLVPALARAKQWGLEAEVLVDGQALRYRLDAGAPIGARVRRARYDSAWERDLARDFATTIGDERAGWSLAREATPVPLAGGELMLPDFTLRHADGREALVEIVGFWTPEYLEEKLRKVRAAGLDHLILVVYRGLAAGDAAGALVKVEGPVLFFANKPRARPVIEAAERVRR